MFQLIQLSNHSEININTTNHNHYWQYIINIKNWTWINNTNKLQICLDISSSNINNMHFETSNKVSMNVIDDDKLFICHFVEKHVKKIQQSGHIYYDKSTSHQLPHYTKHYQARDNTINMEKYLLFNTTYLHKIEYISTVNDNFEFIDEEGKLTLDNQHLPWLFGVFIAIGVVVCIFVCLILYLIKEGFFDDEPSFNRRMKRKRSTMIIMDKKRISAQSHTYNTNCPPTPTPRTPRSTQKNLRIKIDNVTYHSPKAVPNSPHDDMEFNRKESNDTDLGSNDENNDNAASIDSGEMMMAHNNHNKDLSTTHTLDTTKIVHHSRDHHICDFEGSTLMEIHEENEIISPMVTSTQGSPTLTINTSNDESEFEESMVQYVITCSNENSSNPAPFI